MAKEKERKVFQSRDIKLEGKIQEPGPVTKGPATGAELTLTAAQWLERNATAGELEAFKASVQARLERGAATAWRVLPGGRKIKGNSILATCSNCRQWAWVDPGNETGHCVACNWVNIGSQEAPAYNKNGGWMRAASKAEVKAWYAKEEAKLAKFNADAPKRAKDLADFNKRRFEDVGKDER
jgi:hypothetical protein